MKMPDQTSISTSSNISGDFNYNNYFNRNYRVDSNSTITHQEGQTFHFRSFSSYAKIKLLKREEKTSNSYSARFVLENFEREDRIKKRRK